MQPDLKNGLYIVDPESSVIEWTGRNPNTEHFGTVGLDQGRLIVADGKISGEFKIDMNTLTSTNLRGHELQPLLETHLKSLDFFFVKLFPWAWFRLLQATPRENATHMRPDYTASGNLELCGESVPLAFCARLIPG